MCVIGFLRGGEGPTVIVDGLKRGLSEWATNLIGDSNRIIPVHSPLHQVRSLSVGSQFMAALCGVNQPQKVPNLVWFVPQPGIIESILPSACHNVFFLCLTKSSVQAPEERTRELVLWGPIYQPALHQRVHIH